MPPGPRMFRASALAVWASSCTGDPAATSNVSVSDCAVPTVTELFPGALPPPPFGPDDRAPSCLQARHDVIVVLGCPTQPEGSASSCQRSRVGTALRFAEAGLGDTFITTGGAVANEFVEAEAMRDLLVAEGIDPSKIIVEPNARHTNENLHLSGEIMRERGWVSALVVSSLSHLFYVAVCDANCCVGEGRLTPLLFDLGDTRAAAASYVLYPDASRVSLDECAHLTQGSKLQCVALNDREGCDGSLLPD